MYTIRAEHEEAIGMSVPAREAVEPELAGLSQQIVDIVQGAWSDWIKSPHTGVWRCKRSRANFVWEQMIERAHTMFAGECKVRILNGNETFSFLVNDTVLFRFKKADDAGLTSNFPTFAALAFHEHDRDLFGLPEVARVEVAYTLNKLETKVTDVIVVGRNGKQVAWSYSLLDTAEGVVSLPVPTPAGDPQDKSAHRLVKPRNAEDQFRKQRD